MKTYKSNFNIVILLIGFTFLALSQCSVKAPEVNITGEKTALENQIIGTYQQIEEDVLTVASVRAVNPKQKTTMSSDKKRLLEAVQGLKFNRDDIEEFLADEIVGETNIGLLEIINKQKFEQDQELKNRAVTIVNNENNYRKIIMDRIILLNQQAAKAGEATVAKIFAKLNQDNAKPGSWIQLEDGTWIKKGETK